MSNTTSNTESNAAVTITEKERALLEGIRDSQYHDGRDPVDNPTWTWDALDNSGLNPESRGGVASSLEKKGLAWFDQATTKAIGSGDDDSCAITAAGMAALLRHYEDNGINANAIRGDAYVSVDRVDEDGCFRAADYADATTVISVRWDTVGGERKVSKFDPADDACEDQMAKLFEALDVREVSTSSSVDHPEEYGTDVDVAAMLGRALSWAPAGTELEDCDCNGLEALCEECGGRGVRPTAPVTDNELALAIGRAVLSSVGLALRRDIAIGDTINLEGIVREAYHAAKLEERS
jgi:hypothetical protein